jgi:outer membrane autotransporter protein
MALYPQAALGGSAGADDVGLASRWGGFVNGAYGWGYRQPSVLEDAFAFDSTDVTAGVDYRVNQRLVVGFSAGYTDQRLDFDSRRSVAGGGMRSTGYSATLYGLYEWDGPYITAAVGYQRYHFDESRLITYPSNNIEVASPDATASGDSSIDSILTTFSAGWTFNWHAAAAEPYVNFQFRTAHMDGFTETSTDNGSTTPTDAGFGLTYLPQQYRTLDGALGLRLQYSLTPRFAVIVPYVRAEFHHNFLADAYSVESSYDVLASDGPQLKVPTDSLDTHYYEFAGGFSLVLKHGIQGFLQYQMTSGMQYVESRQITGGVRAEF